MKTPTDRIGDHVTIYNMVGQKTACIVVLLNLFSLKFAHADAYYDALRAGGKYDAKTAATIRQNTVEKARIDKMNALTDNNPNFVPLSKLPTKEYTEADLKRMKDADSLIGESAEDKKNEEDVAKFRKDIATQTTNAPAQATQPGLPTTPIKDHAPSPHLAQPSTPVTKVTNEDPDEVSFSGEDDTPATKPIKKPASLRHSSGEQKVITPHTKVNSRLKLKSRDPDSGSRLFN